MNNFLQSRDTLTTQITLTTVLLPLLAFIINICLPGKQNKLSGLISSVFILVSCIFSVAVFIRVWNGHIMHQQLLWFTIGNTSIYAGILLNNLSVLLLMLVNVIALPVHIYSTAYMKDDTGYNRYFAYLSLFCFSMLALVVADSMLLFYAFWELVGFSSYLLIGFWFTRDKAVQANKKAFIINRIGDIGLLTAIIILFAQYHTFDIMQLFGDKGLISLSTIKDGIWVAPAGTLPAIWQYIACGGIFLGVAAKSAQFPLHTWLPDAMEGPTSVSALIHAATMVAAGVFLLGRVYPMFNEAEHTVLTIIGCLTAFIGATIALTQNDLKRILAYSTISQLGYMVMAMGTGAYASSLFHLVTHAFFKCLLFLVAGIVIHQMAHLRDDNHLNIDPQNINNMGGLRKRLPLTFIAAVIGGLALIGLPLTSGYLSKDGILIRVFEWSGNKGGIYYIIPVLAMFTTWLTAFYVIRLIVKVFFGDLKLLQLKDDLIIHIGDGGWRYKLPLLFLMTGCLFPIFSINPFAFDTSWLYKAFAVANQVMESNFHLLIPVVVNLISVAVIYWSYRIYTSIAPGFPQSGFFYNLSFNEWYIDKICKKAIVKPVLYLSYSLFWTDRRVVNGFIHLLAAISIRIAKLTKWTDRNIIDGFLNLLAAIVQGVGNFARRFQSGKIQYYLYSMLVIVLAVFAILILF